MSVKIMFGDEPYIINRKITEQIKKITCPEMNLYRFDEVNDALKSAVETMPVLDDKKLVILTLDEVKGEDTILKLIKSIPNTTDLIIVIKVMDKRTSFYKKAKNDNLLFEYGKLNEVQLKVFIFDMLQENGAKITNRAYAQLIQNLNYYSDPAISLYTVEISIRQIMFLSSVITEEEVRKVIPNSSNEKIYELTKALLSGKYERVFDLALSFIERGENVIGMLSMMQRLFRLGYKATLYSEIGKAELGSLLGVPIYQFQDALSIPDEILGMILDVLQESVNGIKTGRCDGDNMFLLTIGKMLSILHPSTFSVNKVGGIGICH